MILCFCCVFNVQMRRLLFFRRMFSWSCCFLLTIPQVIYWLLIFQSTFSFDFRYVPSCPTRWRKMGHFTFDEKRCSIYVKLMQYKLITLYPMILNEFASPVVNFISFWRMWVTLLTIENKSVPSCPTLP